jgi:hypothetical protein
MVAGPLVRDLVSGATPPGGSHKYTGQICFREKPGVSELESSSLAGIFAIIWSNLCTRHIQKKLTPRGHHDWPDERTTRTEAGAKRIPVVSRADRSLPARPPLLPQY